MRLFCWPLSVDIFNILPSFLWQPLLRAQIVCYEWKGDLSPVMLKEIFHDSFENFEIARNCMENHLSVTGWQKLFFSYKCLQLSAAVAIATFEIYSWKFPGYLILIFSFSLCEQYFSKVNCFRVYRTLITWSSHAKTLLYPSISHIRNSYGVEQPLISFWSYTQSLLYSWTLSLYLVELCFQVSVIPTNHW